MDTMQPWNNMGQGFFRQRPFNRTQTDQSAGQTHEQQNPPDTTQQVEWLSGLSREEKLEAKRLALQASFSFEGYQVVRREFISHQFDPAMTVRWTGITFNNACISKLEDATYIHFLINPTEMKLLIRSVSEGARDAVRWCIVKGEKAAVHSHPDPLWIHVFRGDQPVSAHRQKRLSLFRRRGQYPADGKWRGPDLLCGILHSSAVSGGVREKKKKGGSRGGKPDCRN